MDAAITVSAAYAEHIAKLSRELGIPADYAAMRRLDVQPEASVSDLVTIALNSDQREVRLTPPAAEPWQRMHAAALNAGIVLLPISGFRSVSRQTEIIRDKLLLGQAISDILRLIAAPGYSEHHTGRALDIGSPDEPALEEEFALTAAYQWLLVHAESFGYRLSYPSDNPHGIAFEPWHWFWRGPK